MPKPPSDRVPGTSGSTWLDAPHSEWAVWHLDELAPTVPVAAGPGPARPLPATEPPMALEELALTRYDGSEGSVRDVLDGTDTDAVLVITQIVPGDTATDAFRLDLPEPSKRCHRHHR